MKAQLGAREGGWSPPRLIRFTSWNRTGTRCTEGWVDRGTGLDVCRNSDRPPPPTVIRTPNRRACNESVHRLGHPDRSH